MILSGPPATQQPQETNGSLEYHISFERLKELKRSATFLLASRLDPEAPETFGAEQGGMSPEALVEEIAGRYADEEEFIQAELPVQEIIFRMLVLRRNEPVSLQYLQQQLNERWSTPVRPINVTLHGLKRILDADTYYGFAPVKPEE